MFKNCIHAFIVLTFYKTSKSLGFVCEKLANFDNIGFFLNFLAIPYANRQRLKAKHQINAKKDYPF